MKVILTLLLLLLQKAYNYREQYCKMSNKKFNFQLAIRADSDQELAVYVKVLKL